MMFELVAIPAVIQLLSYFVVAKFAEPNPPLDQRAGEPVLLDLVQRLEAD